MNPSAVGVVTAGERSWIVEVSATLLIPADILTNPAFTVLGRVFNYPDVRASLSIAWMKH